MSRPRSAVPVPVGSLLRPLLLGTSEVPLVLIVRRRTWEAVVVATVERFMRHVVAAIGVVLTPGIPTHPTTVRVSKRAEPFAKRSLTQNRRLPYGWLARFWVANFALSWGMPG